MDHLGLLRWQPSMACTLSVLVWTQIGTLTTQSHRRELLLDYVMKLLMKCAIANMWPVESDAELGCTDWMINVLHFRNYDDGTTMSIWLSSSPSTFINWTVVGMLTWNKPAYAPILENSLPQITPRLVVSVRSMHVWMHVPPHRWTMASHTEVYCDALIQEGHVWALNVCCDGQHEHCLWKAQPLDLGVAHGTWRTISLTCRLSLLVPSWWMRKPQQWEHALAVGDRRKLTGE